MTSSGATVRRLLDGCLIVACTAVMASCASPASHSVQVAWTQTASLSVPNDGSGIANLSGLSCTDSTFCIAGDGAQVLRYTGQSWEQTDSSAARSLHAFSCVSPSRCLALDAEGKPAEFDGRRWALIPNAPPEQLWALSCAKTTFFCMALGTPAGTTSAATEAYTFTFDSHVWTSVSDTATDDRQAEISCAPPDFCAKAAGPGVFDGRRWAEYEGTSSPHNSLDSVSCVSTTFCLAVNGSDGDLTAMTYNGSAWSSLPSKAMPGNTYGDEFINVSCVNAYLCFATLTGGLVAQWDGTRFSSAHHVDPHHGLDVDCTATGFCMALEASVVASSSPTVNMAAYTIRIAAKPTPATPSSQATNDNTTSPNSAPSATNIPSSGSKNIEATITPVPQYNDKGRPAHYNSAYPNFHGAYWEFTGPNNQITPVPIDGASARVVYKQLETNWNAMKDISSDDATVEKSILNILGKPDTGTDAISSSIRVNNERLFFYRFRSDPSFQPETMDTLVNSSYSNDKVVLLVHEVPENGDSLSASNERFTLTRALEPNQETGVRPWILTGWQDLPPNNTALN